MQEKNNKISLYFFIFSIGCVATFIILDLFFYSYNIKKHLMNTAAEIATQKEHQFLDSIKTTDRILHSIKTSTPFNEYLKNPLIYTKDMNDIFLLLARQDSNIMQLRFIDYSGQEQIRIDRAQINATPFVVKENELQNKASRYYFKDSISKPSKIWYSNLDLNIEHGKVEIPYKPTLRAMLPLQENGAFKGLLIINYYMEKILYDFQEIPSHNIIITNKEGYPLIHFDSSKNWGYYQTPKVNLKNEHPELYEALKTTTTMLTSKDYVIKKIDLDLPTKLYVILKLNQHYLNKLSNDRFLHYFVVSLIILILSLLMSTLFSNYLKKVFVVLKDVKSLNKLLNKKVEQQTLELTKSQQQLNDIITTINDFVWEVNEKGEYTYLSPQVKTILGYDPSELIGQTFFSLSNEEEVQKIEHLFKNYLKYAKPIVQLKSKNIHKHGQVVYLEISANPILNDKNEVIGYRGSNRDITQKVNSQKIIDENYKKINQLNKDLKTQVKEEVKKNLEKDMQLFAQSKMAAMGDMIANIAHQWRQPLSAISTTASGVKLKQEYNLLNNDELIVNMDTIVDKTQYLSQTIDTFMSFLKEKKVFKDVSLKETLLKPLHMVQSALENHFITIKTNLDTIEDRMINTVPTELQEVIINILNNAKDALKEHRKDNRTIYFNVYIEDKQLMITIEDNGGGISDAIIDRIFEPYFTTKHESVGTGLGLHMSYRVITESLHGKIYAKNGKEGAIFYIELPLN